MIEQIIPCSRSESITLRASINYCSMAWLYKGIRLLKIQKKNVRIITLSGYSTHSEPLFKQLNMLKIADQLRLQELKFCFKYNS